MNDALTFRWKAGAALVLVFVVGALAGITADRTWGSRRPASAPLTVEALADSLQLDATERQHVRAVADSLDAVVLHAAAQGPESLRAAAQAARLQLESALPPERRPAFRTWMQRHHARMMQRMGWEQTLGPGTLQRDSGRPGMMPRGGAMMRGMMRGGANEVLPTGIAPEDLPEPDAPAARLLARFCTRCHGLPDPVMHTAEEWRGVIDRMLSHMTDAALTRPSASETGAIVSYLEEHGRRR